LVPISSICLPKREYNIVRQSQTLKLVHIKNESFKNLHLSFIDNSRWFSRSSISDSRLLGSLCRCLSLKAKLATWNCFKICLKSKYLFSQNSIVMSYNVSFDLFRNILIYAYNINYKKHNVFNVYNYLDSYSIAICIHNSIAIFNIICLIYIITLNAFAFIKMLNISNIKCISLIYALYFYKK
jgi:hypothetical protein